MKTANDTTMVNLIRSQGIYTQSINLKKARELFQQSIEKAKQIGYISGEVSGINYIGISYGMAGDYSESLRYFRQSLELAKEYQMFEEISNAHNNLGILYKRIGDYPTSQEYYLKNIKLHDSLKLDEYLSRTYVNLGILYDLMDQQDKAIESYHKALEVAPEAERAHYENSVLSNLAVIDFDNKDYKTALDKFLAAIAYYDEQGEKTSQALQYANAGICYLNLKEWQLAQDYFFKSLQLAKELSLQQEIAKAYSHLADLRFRQKRYSEAIDYSNKNLKSLEAMIGSYENKKDAHELAYTIFQESGQMPRAIYHLNQTMVYKDSLLNETKVREIQNLQIQHEVYLMNGEIKENELQLALLNTEVALNNKRMVYLSIIALLLLLSAGLLYFRFRTKKRANILLHNKNQLISQQKEIIEDMNLELEKRMLRAQINPHFMFNSLNSIQHLVNSNDRINALRYLSKFSKLLRQVLESSVNINLVLSEEIELLKIYLELESLRFDNSFTYSINVDDSIDIMEQEVPMLLVQPYLENAILHGLMPKNGPKKLSVSFTDKMQFIECIVKDNGIGLGSKPAANHKYKGLSRGMSITAKRIEAMQKFTDKNLITVENIADSTKTGTKVTILIPKN
ncbi:tetratricopeptide repeat protein [Flagellimonas eckloniae]|nr:tetratricopeptide repeat protein [Allomuricauda eckloniae]